MSFWTTLGNTAANFALDYFTGGSSSGGGGGGTQIVPVPTESPTSAASKASQAAMARTDTGIRAGRTPNPFQAQNDLANFVKSNVNPDVVRKNIVAQLIRQGASPQMVRNVMAQWDTQDKALADPRKAVSSEGFAQKPIRV